MGYLKLWFDYFNVYADTTEKYKRDTHYNIEKS